MDICGQIQTERDRKGQKGTERGRNRQKQTQPDTTRLKRTKPNRNGKGGGAEWEKIFKINCNGGDTQHIHKMQLIDMEIGVALE